MDKNGQVRITRVSGTRTLLPNIAEVGVLRQRYPIMPVHGQGSFVWKELEATKDLLMNSKTYGYTYREPLVSSGVLPTEPPMRPGYRELLIKKNFKKRKEIERKIILFLLSSEDGRRGQVSKETVVLRRWEYYKIIWFYQLG